MATYLNATELREYFTYNPATGELRNKKSRGRGGNVGGIAGYEHKCGTKKSVKFYLRVGYFKSHVYVHRIIWIIMTGEQPEEIDHIDGNGFNNKWDNLRNVPHNINGRNQGLHSSNTSGNSGVTYRKDSGRWRARIMVDDKMISLGTFKDKEDAIEAREVAEKQYGFIN